MEIKTCFYIYIFLIHGVLQLTICKNVSDNAFKGFQKAYYTFRKDFGQYLSNKNIFTQNATAVNERLPFYSHNKNATFDNQAKKWQVERVTRKQFDIVNMLWRKTKIFVNVNDTFPNYYHQIANTTKQLPTRFEKHTPISSPSSSAPHTTTSSNIEFYYLEDEADDHEKQNGCVFPNCEHNNEKLSNKVRVTKTSTFLVFHIKGPSFMYKSRNGSQSAKRSASPSKHSELISQHARISGIQSKTVHDTQDVEGNFSKNMLEVKAPNEVGLRDRFFSKITENYFNYETCPQTTDSSMPLKNTKDDNNSTNAQNTADSTTAYDKIRFFEMYDKNTEIPNNQRTRILRIDFNENTYENDQKILTEHVERSSYDHNRAKHIKKHITERFQKLKECRLENTSKENTKSKANNINELEQIKETSSVTNGNQIKSVENNNYKTVFSYTNTTARWSEYPFTAVYIYEPLQVHCDAAGISAHWLVASGSCLSRVNKSPVGKSRSAFVAYCGERWWKPERVAYVKYSLVHPWYRPRDKTRKHFYNIGVIQVVTSMMLACTGWKPVVMMSHQFSAEPEHSMATAVGWGLDRFDTRYTATDLPKIPLMIYKSMVRSDSCPGNIGYSKAKRLNEGGGVGNVHCLSLPPYTKEESDPVHGGLLLFGEKLVALYLQEERRPWGEQSALYTGIWRVIPWALNVAREPDETDSFTLEI